MRVSNKNQKNKLHERNNERHYIKQKLKKERKNLFNIELPYAMVHTYNQHNQQNDYINIHRCANYHHPKWRDPSTND